MKRAPASAVNRVCKGADAIAVGLLAMDVTTVFCYPGGANLEILDALSRVDIRLIRTEHEQGAVFAAQGYARSTGRLGVCLATSGPGATNLVTGIADANSDSIPVLAITGNVATHWLGRNAFQEVDIVSIVRPITKSARQVRSVVDIAETLQHMGRLALEGRPGPVVLDIPKDIQQAQVDAAALFRTVETIPACDERNEEQAGNERAAVPGVIAPDQLAALGTLIAGCSRPVIYAGGGVIASGTGAQLVALAEQLDCPVVLTLMGLGAMPSNHPLLLGPLGMHGAHVANVAVNEADLVLALGVRFDDRVIGDPAAFAAAANIVHIDVDAAELGKNKAVQLGIAADLGVAMAQLPAIAGRIDTSDWRAYLSQVDGQHPLAVEPSAAHLSGARAIAILADHLPGEAIVATGVGQHQMWAMQHCRPEHPRHFLSSAGFGTMGFGLPAALGAKVARPEVPVVDIDGDGSLNMVINELSTLRRNAIGVKVFVVNNQWLGMVRQWQDMIYANNRVLSASEDGLFAVKERDETLPYPDFVTIARGYGVAAERVTREAALGPAISRMLADPDQPYLLDVIVTREDDVYPMIPAGRSYRDVIFSRGEGRVGDT